MSERSARRTLWIIVFTSGLNAVGFGILLPILPQLLTNPASPHYLLAPTTSRETGYFLLGCLVAVFPLMQFMSTPVLGQLSDRYGRRPLLGVSIAGTAVASAGLAIGVTWENLPVLFVARAIDGITGGNVSIARAVIADVTEPKDRTRTLGLTTGAFGIGLILGPFLGGTLADSSLVSWFDAATPFWFATILAALNTLGVYLLLDETRTPTRAPLQLARALANIARAYARPQLRVIYASLFLLAAGSGAFMTVFGAFLIYRYNFDERQIGNFFGYQGVWVIITQLVTVRWMAKRVSEVPLLRVTLLGVSIALAIYVLPIAAWVMYLVAPCVSTFNGMSLVNCQGLLSRSAGRDEQGEVMGIAASVQALALALPPLAAGTIASALSPVDAILAAALLMFAGWLAFVLLYRQRVKTIA